MVYTISASLDNKWLQDIVGASVTKQLTTHDS